MVSDILLNFLIKVKNEQKEKHSKAIAFDISSYNNIYKIVLI